MKKVTLKALPLLLSLAFSSSYVFGQTAAQRQAITQNYNTTQLQQLSQRFEQEANAKKTAALQMAIDQGWETFIVNPNGSVDELMDVSPDGKPIYFTVENVAAARSTRANHLNIGGSLGLNLDGQNMVAYVWDGGATRITHQEFDGPGGNNRVAIVDGVTSLNSNSFHAQHVTGTIVASGFVANAKGMAPQAQARTADWNNDLSEATTQAANGMLLSNHSYGYRANTLPDWYFGAYIAESRDWDELMHDSPFYLMVVAAGNDGNDNTSNLSPIGGNSSYDKLSGHATAKNNMVVANAQDANVNNDGSLNSVVINSSSSEGPTDDLRIKPDITGNGTTLYSTDSDNNSDYATLTGTSMASPNVTGSLLLLQQHYNNLNGSFMRAATLKGLALHTADDAGPTGPDAVYGWGLMNTKAAAEAITAKGNGSIVDELNLNSGQTYTITVNSNGTDPLMASISWTDLPGTANTGTTNLSTPVLVNDLDIRITKNSTTHLPYKLTSVNSNAKGDNNVDPYERIDVSNAVGTYTITVTHKGNLSGGSQAFSPIVTGISSEPIVCNTDVPNNLGFGALNPNSANITWDAVPGASYDLRYREVGSTWSVVSVNSNFYNLTGLTPETQYEVQVRSKCDDGETSNYSASVFFTTPVVPLNYCASQGNSSSDEFIQSVAIGAFSNVSGNNGGYHDYTSSIITVTKGQATSFTLTPGFSGSSYNETWKLFADLNKDGDFTDAGETLFTSSNTSSAVNGSITIPASAITGNTRLRVSMKYNGASTPCEAFSYGEVEDYTLQLEEAGPQPCDIPTGLATSNVTTTSVDLSWNAVNAANSYLLQHRVSGASWSTQTVSGTNATISGLNPSTSYDFRIASDCDNETSAYSNTVSATTNTPPPPAYCSSNGSAGSEWIEQVILGNVNNVSNSNNGYGNYTSLTVNATKGASFNFTLNPGFTSSIFFGENTQPEYWRIYIDYNGDKDFDDAGELAYDAGGTSTGNVSGSITVPANAITGTTRVRVSMKRSSAAAACGNIGNGEVEDYTINISEPAAPTCDTPTGISTSGVSSSAFTVNWSSSANASSYDVDMRPSGGSWTTVNTSGTSYTFSGLAASTNYEYRVASICSFGTSSYSATGSVTTSSNNPPPANYCNSQGGTSDEWIASVTIAGVNNNSGNNSGYGNFTNVIMSANQGETVSFSLNPGFNSGLFGTTTYPEYWRIWIDYNQDGDFNDAGELAFDAGSTSTTTVSGSFTVPAGASSGSTRMRVSMKYNAAATPCESFSYGEVEDYTFSIGTGSQSFAVSSLENKEQSLSRSIEMTVAPNPTSDVANIQLDVISDYGEYTLTVMDLTGKVVQLRKLNALEGESMQQIKLDLSNEATGTYMVVVRTASGYSKAVRLVKR